MGQSSSQLRAGQPAGRLRAGHPSTTQSSADPTDARQGHPGVADGSAVTAVISEQGAAEPIVQSRVPPGAADDIVTSDDRTVISSSPPESRQTGSQTAAELGRQLVGEQLDHFLLEQYVGGGGMGAVFRATDTLL